MATRTIVAVCACVLLAAACTRRDASPAAPAAAPATAAAPAAEPEKDKSWAGQVNQARAVASAQGKAAQDQAAKADAVGK